MKQYGKRTKVTVSLLTTLLLLSGCKNVVNDQLNDAAAANPNSGGNTGSSGSTGGSSGDSPPKISGSPRSAVKIGDSYSFTPTANDPDGDSLNFFLGNQPRWAEFNSKTGKLSGKPGPGDVGTYSNIQVAVSDGSTAVYLPSFSVNVVQSGSASGSATISWTPPTQNTDGSPLTNLAAYKIYYGVSEGYYPNQIRINNPGISTFVVDNLIPDTYFFVSTSINSNGVESEYSNVARKTVN